MLANWDPFTEMQRFQEELMNRRVAGRNGNGLAFRPAVDIFEDDGQIVINAELPGMKPEDVDIDVHEGILTLRGERRLENEERREGYHRVERSYGSFSRSFSLPEGVDPDGCQANMTDGVLTVTLPKKPLPEPKKIEVKAAGGK